MFLASRIQISIDAKHFLDLYHPRIYVTRGLTRNKNSLPILVSWKFKWFAGVLLFLITVGIYSLSNRYPLYPPKTVRLVSLDSKIPFLPWTIWIYLSIFIYLIVVYFLNRCVVSLNKHLYSFLTLVLISGFIFNFCPSAYPRELYPLHLTLNHSWSLSWSETVTHWTRCVDLPVNSAPSLHVSAGYLIAFGFLEDLQAYFPIMFVWSTLMAISTLTTKQHAILDVVTGFFLAVILYILFHRTFKYRLLTKSFSEGSSLEKSNSSHK